MDELQAIADRIATRLDRAVYIEDGSFRPLATSSQFGRIDDARVQALLFRGPSEQHLRYFAECGVPDAREPVRIPGSEEQELLPRMVVPVVEGKRVLARVWLIDSEPPVDETDAAWVVATCEAMRPYLADRDERSRRGLAIGTRLVRGIERAGSRRREGLVGQLCEQYQIESLRNTHACVIRFGQRDGEASAAADGKRMEQLLATVAEPLDVHRAAGYARDGELRMLVTAVVSDEGVLQPTVAAARRAALVHGVSVDAVGIGAAMASADGFDSSFGQAVFAARVASCVPAFDRAVDWDRLGEYRLFSAVEWGLGGVASLHRGVAALVSDRQSPLAATLLAYLEREGDIDETAKALNVHRTTLYYRVRRAKEVVGEDPVGATRFGIHAALKFADLIGLCAPARRG